MRRAARRLEQGQALQDRAAARARLAARLGAEHADREARRQRRLRAVVAAAEADRRSMMRLRARAYALRALACRPHPSLAMAQGVLARHAQGIR